VHVIHCYHSHNVRVSYFILLCPCRKHFYDCCTIILFIEFDSNVRELLPRDYDNDVDVETGETMKSVDIMAIEKARAKRRINRKRRSGSQSLLPMESRQNKIQSVMQELLSDVDWNQLRDLCDKNFATTGIYANYHRKIDIADAYGVLKVTDTR
jgi:hypothetical protein